VDAVEDAPAGAVAFEVGAATGRYVLLLVTQAPEGPACRRAPYQARVGEIRFGG
jgi:hypothetical protein